MSAAPKGVRESLDRDLEGGRRRNNLPVNNNLNNTNNTHNTRPNTSSLPTKLAPLVQTPSLVSQNTTQAEDNSHVGSKDRLGLGVGQALKLGEQPAPGAGSLPLGLLLGTDGPLARVCFRLLARDAIRLGAGLNGLRHKVGGDCAHGLGVYVD
jgi:hypothetical protein